MIATEVSLNDADGISQGIEFINQVAGDSRFGEWAYRSAILMTELIEKMGHRNAVEPAVEKLVQSVPNVRRTESRPAIQLMVDEFMTRWKLKGSPFHLDATGAEQVDLSIYTGKIVVIVFHDHSVKSHAVLEMAGSPNNLVGDDVSFVAIEIGGSPENSGDRNKLEASRQDLRAQHPQFIFLNSVEADHILKQCPVRSGQFVIVLDQNHNVVATNVDPDDLRLLLQQLIDS